MNIGSAHAKKAAATANDALITLRERAETFSAAALPRAASAAETAGRAVSDFALSSSRSVAKSLREHNGGKAIASATSPLLRSAVRIARNNPLLFATAGIAIAVLSYAALHKRHEEEELMPA